ncbi:MAG: transketolase C-terminal domain-containing protein [Gammaproteobacteria bacterium]
MHEAVQVGGFGAEIAATVAEQLFSELRAPVRRLGHPNSGFVRAPWKIKPESAPRALSQPYVTC